MKAAEKAALNVHKKLNLQSAPIRQYLVRRTHRHLCHDSPAVQRAHLAEPGPVSEHPQPCAPCCREQQSFTSLCACICVPGAGRVRRASPDARAPGTVQGAAGKPSRVPRVLPAVTQPTECQATPSVIVRHTRARVLCYNMICPTERQATPSVIVRHRDMRHSRTRKTSAAVF